MANWPALTFINSELPEDLEIARHLVIRLHYRNSIEFIFLMSADFVTGLSRGLLSSAQMPSSFPCAFLTNGKW